MTDEHIEKTKSAIESAGNIPADRKTELLDLLSKLNELDMEKFPGATDLSARISSYELAYRLQTSAPELMDLKSESKETLALYGADPDRIRIALDLTPGVSVAPGIRQVTVTPESFNSARRANEKEPMKALVPL